MVLPVQDCASDLSDRRADALDDDLKPANDEVVGKAKNAESRPSKPFVPFGIFDLRFRRLVRATVRFDDDFAGDADEIREIGPNGHLPAKAAPVDPMIAHRAPKHRLRSRHVLTLRPRELP